MVVSYKKLWHILVDRNMKKKDLEEAAHITHYQMYRGLDSTEKTCGIRAGSFFEKVSENVSFFGFESCGIGLWEYFFKNRVVFQPQKLL